MKNHLKEEKSRKRSSFKPRKGQIDYTDARWVPVINCVLRHSNKLLVVQRSKDLNFYPGYWNGVSGFLDDQRSLKQKVLDEIKEELGMTKNKIKSIKLGEMFLQEESKYKKTWIVHPVLVEVMETEVHLDWEATNYQWLSLSTIKKLKLLPGFQEVLKRLPLSKPMPNYRDFVALAKKRFEEKQAQKEKRNKTGPFQFTRHSLYKMRQYNLSEQKVRNVIRNPRRTEKGIVKRTIAVMQPVSVKKENGKETWKQEIWVMYQEGKKGSALEPAKRKIISAWRYPGVSPKRDPIPENILRELLEGTILEGEE